MTAPFAERLMELLPAVYRERDADGDLAAFLGIAGPTLDEITDLINRFPSCWDVDACDDAYLPLLAATLGIELDLKQNSESQRRTIREAIEQFRRKATLPAMRHTLKRLGWQGRINETYRQAFRLNRRGVTNQRKLPGQRFSLGVYQVESEAITNGLPSALAPHHPAGTRRFYLQHLRECTSVEPAPVLLPPAAITMVGAARDYETFTVGRNRLNADWHLTVKAKTHEQCGVQTGYEVHHDVPEGGVIWRRWHARRAGFRISQNALNQAHIQNLQTREVKCAFTGLVESEPRPLPASFHCGKNVLNKTCIAHGNPPFHVVYRQKDFLSEATPSAPIPLGEAATALYADRARLADTFRVRHSRLGGGQRLTGVRISQSALTTQMGVSVLGRACEAHDIVDRWEARRDGFALGTRSRLNALPLASARTTQARASFELDVDTAWPYGARAESVHLNRRRLNHAALRMSADRTTPLRLSRTRLNAAALRVSNASFRWRYRQRDWDSSYDASLNTAANTFRATQWPATPDNCIWANGAPLAAYNRYLATRWPEA